MQQEPSVTVVMATFNEPSHQITKAIQSIVAQTYVHWELLVLDDSTNPDTIQAIDNFSSDSRIIVLRNRDRLGFVKSLNKGLKLAKGEYIARMDGDDISLPNRLSLQVDYLKSHADIALLGGSVNIIDDNDAITSYRSYPTTNDAIMQMAIYRNPLAHPTVMFRKSVLDAGFLYDENLKKAEDLDLWLRLILSGFKLSCLPQVILHYRVVGDLSTKRRKDNWKYNLTVRARNFRLKRPIFSIISVFTAILYFIAPEVIIRTLYRLENNKNRSIS